MQFPVGLQPFDDARHEPIPARPRAWVTSWASDLLSPSLGIGGLNVFDRIPMPTFTQYEVEDNTVTWNPAGVRQLSKQDLDDVAVDAGLETPNTVALLWSATCPTLPGVATGHVEVRVSDIVYEPVDLLELPADTDE